MRFCIAILMLLPLTAGAQIPRNAEGVFEYSQVVTSGVGNEAALEEKAGRFFDQPFLVHWDTVYRMEYGNTVVLKGRGYVNVRAKLHFIAAPKKIPVSLDFTLQVEKNAYRYTVNNFAVNKPGAAVQFAFEKKPETLKQLIYDQLLEKTHQRISFITGYLKRYMNGEYDRAQQDVGFRKP